MIRIYLAGPDVFLPDPLKVAQEKKDICLKYGFEGIFPLDNQLNFKGLSKQQIGLLISKSNEDLIKTCQIIVANITPFRGPSLDVGTAFEIGYGRALGLSIYAYSNVAENFITRNRKYFNLIFPKTDRDVNNMSFENFDMIDNLMIDGAMSGKIIITSVPENEKYTNLVGFEECIKNICG